MHRSLSRGLVLALLTAVAVPGARGQPSRIAVTCPLAEGVAALDGGSIVFVDRGGPRVALLDAASEITATAGGFGHGVGKFRNPIDVVAAGNDVWVLDRFERKITLMVIQDTALLPVRDIALDAALDPEAIERAPDGRLLVLDAGLNCIIVLDADGKPERRIGGPGRGPDGVSCPHDLVLSPDGVIYVADAGNRRIQRYRFDGTCLGPWGSYGDGPDQFNDPTGVAIDENGDLIVADHYGHRIQVLSTVTGKEYFERRMNLPEHIRYPARIAVLPGNRCVFSCPQLSEIWEVQCP